MAGLGTGEAAAMVAVMDLASTFEGAQPFRLTVDHYLALDDIGAFDDCGRVELIEGMIVQMNSMSVDHAQVSSELWARLRDRLREIGSPLTAFAGATVTLPPKTALDPDVTVADVRGGEAYLSVSAVKLMVEVSKATLRKDLGPKRDIYAAAGVPEYWVVDVDKRRVHRFAIPRDGVYTVEPPVPLAGPLTSLTIPDLVIDGAGIL